MKQLLLVAIFIVGCYCACLIPTSQPTPEPNLNFCTEYRDSACCNAQADADLAGNFTQRIAPLLGANNCASNAKSILCALACHPNQTEFSNLNLNPLGAVIFVEPEDAETTYDSCKDRCVELPILPTMTIRQLFGIRGVESFFGGLSAPDPTNPGGLVLQLRSGVKPGGRSFDFNALPASAEDTGGCTSPRCFGTPGQPIARDLTFCPEHASSSCCTLEQESALRGNFTKVQALFGTDGCSDNIRKLFCGWTCGGNQYDFIDYIRGFQSTPANLNVSVNFEFANSTFGSCSTRCVDTRTNRDIVDTLFGVGKPASLIAYFNSANDPGYQPNTDTLPVMTYNVVVTGGFSATVSPASGEDLTGCPAKPEEGAAVISSPLVLLIAVISIMLSVVFI